MRHIYKGVWLMSLLLVAGSALSQDLLTPTFTDRTGANTDNPTAGIFFSPRVFTADETVTLFIDVSMAAPRGDDRFLGGTTQDLFLFFFDGTGSLGSEPIPELQLTPVAGVPDLFSIDIDLSSGEIFDATRIADGESVEGLLRANAFEDGQTENFEIAFNSFVLSEAATSVPAPGTFMANETISILLNSDLAEGDGGGNMGQLTGQTDVFLWSGANNFTFTPEGQVNFNEAFEPGRLDVLSDNIFRITLIPTEFYGIPAGTVVENIAFLFKNTDGSLTGRDEGGADFVIDVAQPVGGPVVAELFTVFPEEFTADDIVTITFTDSIADGNGNLELINSEQVFFFAGASTSAQADPFEFTPEGQEFNNPDPSGVGAMTQVAQNSWRITIVPRAYFGIPAEQEVDRITVIFRSPLGTRQTSPDIVLSGADCVFE